MYGRVLRDQARKSDASSSGAIPPPIADPSSSALSSPCATRKPLPRQISSASTCPARSSGPGRRSGAAYGGG
jgi:hypothetical protein